ncbi:MAG: hypothetical protein HC923_09145 [Myxococcales bacterium]|nr:hypothetical protein [Myxococcales bacterium]
MVTGSHIPFDRNGIKFNKPAGEVLKDDEAGILAAIRRRRTIEYLRPAETSPFADDGSARAREQPRIEDASASAAAHYKARFSTFFGEDALQGLTVAFYEHSAAGRELIPSILEGLGATVRTFGRSDSFVAIDTEAISRARLGEIERELRGTLGPGAFDAVVSTDGDSDRPLMCFFGSSGQLTFLPGDRLGALAATELGATHAVVPVSATDVLEDALPSCRISRTRIGSPHVISRMLELDASLVEPASWDGRRTAGSCPRPRSRANTERSTRCSPETHCFR